MCQYMLDLSDIIFQINIHKYAKLVGQMSAISQAILCIRGKTEISPSRPKLYF